MELQLSFPLTGNLNLDYGKREFMKAKNLLPYANEIQKAFEQKSEFSHMQEKHKFFQWFKGSPDIYKNIRYMKTTVVAEKNGLFGEMTFYCRQALNHSEQMELSEYVDEQFAHGMGKKLLSHPISVPGGILHVQMWEPFTSEFLIDEQKAPVVPKYRITDITHLHNPKLKRIQALCDINPNVQKGDLGGFIEKEWNLSQSGKCWIHDDAVSCDCARVEMDAQMFQVSKAKDRAIVTGSTGMYGRSLAGGDAYIKDATIKNYAMICGEAVLETYGKNSRSPLIGGNSKIYGTISGGFVVSNSTVFSYEKLINPTQDLMVLEHGKKGAIKKEELDKNQRNEPIRKIKQPER